MASLKVVLRTNKQKKDGTSPLALRVTKDRKTSYVFTGQYILEKDWSPEIGRVKKSHPNSARLNNLLLKKIAQANDLLLEVEASKDNVSVKEIKNKIKRSGQSISFFEVAAERIKNYKDKGTFSVANADQSMVNNLKKFTKGRTLYFEEITLGFLEKYKAFCFTGLGQKSKRTVTNQLVFIRTLFNIGLKQGIVDRKYYPFAGDKEKIRLGSGLKIGLTKEEVARIENIELEPQSQIWHARNIWLFAYYFAGIRISDVLKLSVSYFKDDRLYYVMNKNEKPISLKIPDKAKAILSAYKIDQRPKQDFIFPYLKDVMIDDKRDVFLRSRNAARLINKYLKKIAQLCEINKTLSNHIARHTFGNIAGDKIHPLMLQKLYRHSDLKTTINYQANFIHKEADEALDSVLNSE